MNVGELIERLTLYPRNRRVVSIGHRGEDGNGAYDDADYPEEVTIAPDAERNNMGEEYWENQNPHGAVRRENDYRDFKHEKAILIR